MNSSCIGMMMNLNTTTTATLLLSKTTTEQQNNRKTKLENHYRMNRYWKNRHHPNNLCQKPILVLLGIMIQLLLVIGEIIDEKNAGSKKNKKNVEGRSQDGKNPYGQYYY